MNILVTNIIETRCCHLYFWESNESKIQRCIRLGASQLLSI